MVLSPSIMMVLSLHASMFIGKNSDMMLMATKLFAQDLGVEMATIAVHTILQLRFKGNVRNIRVKVLGATGLAWEPWRLIYSKNDLPLVPQRNISTWGTTLHPQFEDKVVKDNTD